MNPGEWLETDGLGGYACSPVRGPRRRRYHGLLVTAAAPPARRAVLVAGCDLALSVGGREIALTTQRYAPGILHPVVEGDPPRFRRAPWPTWEWQLPGGGRLLLEIFMTRGMPRTVLRATAHECGEGLRLHVRPLLAFRDHHALCQGGQGHSITERSGAQGPVWCRAGLPPLVTLGNGCWSPRPDTWHGFRYDEEAARGFDHEEDLHVPGRFTFDLGSAPACLLFQAGEEAPGGVTTEMVELLAERERARRQAGRPARLAAAEAYLVRRGSGRTIIAGYPWFTDWGRDTFIAMRGLLLATGRLREARDVLEEWARHVSRGMLPNRFPEQGEAPEYGSADAALWFVIVAAELAERERAAGAHDPDRHRILERATRSIIAAHVEGTRHGIRQDRDGLLAAGGAGSSLTWMDARVAGRAVTPRVGKPVELQALWINALHAARGLVGPAAELESQARRAFLERFVDLGTGLLHDVVDVDHQPGLIDSSCRPNQLLAVGGLPRPLLDGVLARNLVKAAFERLWTPLGPRSLAPGHRAYRGTYGGSAAVRDSAYHQGTVWPWLAGPFIEAWIRVHGDDARAREEARRSFLEPLLAQADPDGSGHLPELADGDPPHAARGCPFQAWSLGEVLRLELEVLAPARG